MNKNELERLLAQAIEGDLNDADGRQLLEACRDDASVVRRLADLIAVERNLHHVLEQDSDHFAGELVRRIRGEEQEEQAFQSEVFTDRVIQRLQWGRRIRLASIGAAAALVCVGLILFFQDRDKAVAQIVRAEAERWQPVDANLDVGDRLDIGKGLVSLRYQRGVTVVLEGPADFEITGDSSGFLHRGRLVVEVSEIEGRGFAIDGPHGRLIDLGTRFGVSVEDDGAMEVHVLEGVVDAVAKSGEITRLRENEAMRLGAAEVRRLPNADESAFVTQLPPNEERPPRYVRWRFDEPKGEFVRNDGNGLGGGEADAHLKAAIDSEQPQRIEGVFGGALRFDGSGAYAESAFRGIGGTGPRTVSFWVRVRKDFGDREGFGIVNWGSYAHEGAAWQVAVNSYLPQGPLGRLRVGTHGGEVVGSTDLRDGKWHHCAVVMYGDKNARPNTATHVLLYVDGLLESAQRKSIRSTEIRSQVDHGIWMGRNLAYTQEGKSSGGDYGKFFRGDIDEMIIADTALSQREIQSLMNRNVMP